MRKKVKGAVFTIEVAFFILAVALIAGYMFSNYQPTMDEAKIQVAITDVTTIGGAVSHYHYDMKKYPSSLSQLTKMDAATKKGPWIASLPNNNKDPWGKAYGYVYDTNEADGNVGFVVFCTTSTKGTSVSINIGQANNLPANSIAYHGL